MIRAARVAMITNEISLRLRRICSQMPDAEFVAMVAAMAALAYKYETRLY